MQAELEIRKLLGGFGTPKEKAELICKIVDWDKNKLEKAIIKHGYSESRKRSEVVKEFWKVKK